MITAATWNVNSVRARLDRLCAWLDRVRPDVVCLQELKAANTEFPYEALAERGYRAAVHGQKSWNGVAILSRTPLEAVRYGFGDGVDDGEARFVEARTAGIRVVSLYVPNGQVVGSAKWDFKLRWLERLERWLAARATPGEPLLLGGDYNIAPEDRDVARPDEWRGTVLTDDAARAAFRRLLAWGLVDSIRIHHHDVGPFSWWDYRMLGFQKNNGLRIDHVLVTRPLAGVCLEARVDRDERKGKLPSDHAPVVARFEWPETA